MTASAHRSLPESAVRAPSTDGGPSAPEHPDPSGPSAPERPDPSGSVARHHAKGDRRARGTIWRANPREQGLIGLTDAISWFGSQGWFVCLPLIDSQPYDLVVDDGARLLRVQVKTTTHRGARGRFIVTLCTSGGNQSFHTKKRFDPSSCDLLYVLTDDHERYLIPAETIEARSGLTLGAKVERYRIGTH